VTSGQNRGLSFNRQENLGLQSFGLWGFSSHYTLIPLKYEYINLQIDTGSMVHTPSITDDHDPLWDSKLQEFRDVNTYNSSDH
jgi:hypothetical protein